MRQLDSAGWEITPPSPIAPTANQQSPNQIAQTSALLVTIAAAIFGLLFAVTWGPYYLSRSEYNLFLYPVIFACLPLVGVPSILGIIFGIIGLDRASRLNGLNRSFALWGFIGGSILVALPVPALWFGNLPIVLLFGP